MYISRLTIIPLNHGPRLKFATQCFLGCHLGRWRASAVVSRIALSSHHRLQFRPLGPPLELFPGLPEVATMAKPAPEHASDMYNAISKLVAADMIKYSVYDKPVAVKCFQTGACKYNRKTMDPNIVYVHTSLHEKVDRERFDPNKCHEGILVKTSKGSRVYEENLAHNDRFTKNSKLYPRIDYECMTYFTLAHTHLSMLLRLTRQGATSEITGRKFEARADDNYMRQVLEEGHQYRVLKEDTPTDVLVRVSDYNNSDNGQTQCVHDMEIIKACQRYCKEQEYINYQAMRKSVIPRDRPDVVTHSAAERDYQGPP